jgi:adenine-specific DNA-methyltransferase
MERTPKGKAPKNVDALTHGKARRVNVPTAELQSLAEQQEELQPLEPLRVPRVRPLAKTMTRVRDEDLDTRRSSGTALASV